MPYVQNPEYLFVVAIKFVNMITYSIFNSSCEKKCFMGRLNFSFLFLSFLMIGINLQSSSGNTGFLKTQQKSMGYYLHESCASKNLEMVKKSLSELCIDINSKNDHWQTALHIGCQHGNVDIVTYLLSQKNININSQDKDGLTSLHYACCNDHFNIVSNWSN